jgi:hypothetical protein
MPAALKTCEVCDREFYGRTDALYCTTACRQQAYRQRIRNATPTITASITGHGPVPIGDRWMGGRFGGAFGGDYPVLADVAKRLEATVKTPTVRRKRLYEAEDNAARVIKEYVDAVAAIAHYSEAADGFDFDTPLGGALPGTVDAQLAEELATKLQAAMPRVVELTSLLIRRSTQERRGIVETIEATESCDVHGTDSIRHTSAGEPYCMACDYMLFI